MFRTMDIYLHACGNQVSFDDASDIESPSGSESECEEEDPRRSK
eukprot:COSAG03_NODE_759_length_5968_cov_39.290169_5_plen_44_part_00